MMCTPLWIACVDTPSTLCAAWGQPWGQRRSRRAAERSTCCYTIHRLCGEKTWAEFSHPQQPEVIHTRRMTGRVWPAARVILPIRRGVSVERAIVRVCVRPRRRLSTRSPVRSMTLPRTAATAPRTLIWPSVSPGSGACWPTSTPSWPSAAQATSTPPTARRPGGREAGPPDATAPGGRKADDRGRLSELARNWVQDPAISTSTDAATSGCRRTRT